MPAEDTHELRLDEERKLLSTEDMNDLPDSDFAYIEPGGEKDAEGKTTPRSKRHYPVHDKAHALNALQRAEAQTKNDGPGKDIAEKAMPAILAACHKFGIDVGGNSEAKAALQSVQGAANRAIQQATQTFASTTFAGSGLTIKQRGVGYPVLDVKVTREPAPAAFRSEMLQVREERVPVRREFELREVPNGTGGTDLKFTGFACVTDARYEMEDWLGTFGETVSKGAFTKTLAEGADCAFLMNHKGMTLARTKPGTLKLSEVTEPGLSPIIGVTGLHSEALFDPKNMYVQAMRSGVERGDLDEMSFAFRVMRQEWNEDYTERYINEVSVHYGDVSLVNFGANPHTGGTVDLRQRINPRARGMDFERVREAILELRSGKTISAATADTLGQALGHLDMLGDSSDNVRSLLSDLLAADAAASTGPEGGDAPEESLSTAGLFYDVTRDRSELEGTRYHRRAA